MSIIIDKEFQSLIPPLSLEEFQQLEENCVKEGIRDALIVWKQPDGNDILIDGHNRWNISVKHGGIPFQIKRVEFPDRNAVKLWIIDNQIGRRNLNLYDRTNLEDQKKRIIAEQAKEKRIEGNSKGGKSDKKSCPTSQTRQEKRENSTDYKIAKAAGTSEDTVRKVRAIRDSGDQKLINDVRSGETTINRAYQVVKGIDPIKTKSPAQMHKERIDKAQEEHEQFQQQKVIGFSDISKDKENRRTLAKEMYRRLISLGSKIEEVSIQSEAGDIDLKAIGKELTHEEKKMLLDMIGIWRQQLTKISQEVTSN